MKNTPGLTVGLCILALLAMGQSALLARKKGVWPYSPDVVTPGELADEKVVDSEGVLRTLRNIGAGKCRLVVLAATTCPHCVQLQTRWTVQTLREGKTWGQEWAVFWVTLDRGVGSFFDPEFPTETFVSVDGLGMLARLGLSGVPSHLVLDRNGRLVTKGLGADKPAPGQLNRNCALHAPTVNEE